MKNRWQQATGRFALLASLCTVVCSVCGQTPMEPGLYNGLFHETDAVRHARSGCLTLKLTPHGAFSGQLTLAGVRQAFSGRLPPGTNSVAIAAPRGTGGPITIQLSAADPDVLEGFVGDGLWLAPVRLERQVWDKKVRPPTMQIGYYTVSTDLARGPLHPNGFGYGTLAVDSAGAVRLTAVLGDGTRVTQKSALGASGCWPLYATLYGGRGMVLGWIPVSNVTHTAGSIEWHKPPGAPGLRYPAGFTLQESLYVSPYRPPPPGRRVINIGSGYVSLEGGHLTAPLVTVIRLTPANKCTSLDALPFGLTINPRTGLFTGSVSPANGARIKFAGMLSQSVDMGIGQFLSPANSGSVVIAGQAP